jgi:dTDP-4-dehydrorhamnose reductase
MKWLVTGANGLLGSRICRQLEEKGGPVTALGRGERRVSGSFAYQACDLSREDEALRTIQSAGPEIILHPASMTEVDACEREPRRAFTDNVLASANVALAARACGAHLVHVSTDYVFDGDAGPYDEEALPNPRGVYALTKHMGEQAVRALAPSFAIARTAVVYGWPPASRPNFGAWLLGALRGGQEVRLFQDQFVSPSLADNVAKMLIEIGARKLTGVWNTAGRDTVNRVEFAEAMCAVFGFSRRLIVPTRLAEAKLASPRPLRSGLKPDKAVAQLAAKPLGLAESLERFRQAFRSQG